jgi:hypothetical protein
VEQLVDAAQAGRGAAQFAEYYRFAIFANAFVVLLGVFAYRLGGASTARVAKVGLAGVLVLISGLNDLTMWLMYPWPNGARPEVFDWASHVTIFIGREPHVSDMLIFLAVHTLLIVAILAVPLERWLTRRPQQPATD